MMNVFGGGSIWFSVKRLIPSITFFFLISFSLTIASFASEKNERAAARVGDITITESQLEEVIDKYVPPGSFHGTMDPSKRYEYRKDALNELIEIELLYKEAWRTGIRPSEEYVKQAVDENIRRFGSEKAFKESLKKNGLSLDGFRKKLRKYQVVDIFWAALLKESAYTDKELNEYYETNKSRFTRPEALRLYHILIKVESSAPDEEWQKKREYAEQLLKKIRSGESFEDTAYQYSEDPYKFKGGDLGFIHRGQLNPTELEEAAFSLKKDEVSGVIRTIYGFHILKAGERKPEETLSFEETKEKLGKELQKKKFEERKKELLEKLRNQYTIVIYPRAAE
jgi:foldase protein PrsA